MATRDVQAVGTDATGSTFATYPTAAYNQAANKVMVVTVEWEGDLLTCTVADTAGNTFSPATRINDTVHTMNIRQFYCLVSLAHATNVVTATFTSGAADYLTVRVESFTPSGTPAFVGQGSGTGTSTHAVSGSVTGGNFAVGGIKDFSGGLNLTPDSGWTIDYENTANATHFVDSITATTPTTCGGTFVSSTDWLVSVLTFSESGAAANVLDPWQHRGAMGAMVSM